MADHFIMGIHAVESLIHHHPERIKQLWIAGQKAQFESIIQAAQNFGVHIQYSEKRHLDKKVEGNHQGVVAQVVPSKPLNDNDLEKMLDDMTETPLFLGLDGVTDPHNLGACLRSAEAAGVHGLIVPRDKSVQLNATVSKVACGAAEIVPVFTVTNLVRTLLSLKDRGIWVTATAGEADKYIYDIDFKGPSAIIMGAEGKGVRRLTRESCDFLAKLPMAGHVSSLNVSVATGICLFEAVRQRLG